MQAYHVTDIKDDFCERRKPLPHHLSKHILELGDNEHHQNTHDDHRNYKDGDGVKHGGLDLPLDSHGLLHEHGQAVQHHLQHTAEFACLDHADEQLVEHLGMLGQALGEGTASLNHLGQLTQHTSQRWRFLLLFEHPEAAKEGQPSGGQLGQLAGEYCEVFLLNLAAQPGDVDLHSPEAFFDPFFALRRAALGFLRGCLSLLHLGGGQAHLLQPSQRLGLTGGGQFALLSLPALGVYSLVLKGGHDYASRLFYV